MDYKNWYLPLQGHFQTIESAMPIERFAQIEAVLYLLHINEPHADPAKAYLLFSQYHLIGATTCSAAEHTLQLARNPLGNFRSQKYWQDSLRAYREPRYDAYRAFIVTGPEFGPVPAGYPYSFEERKGEWARFWAEGLRPTAGLSYAQGGTYRYTYPGSEKTEAETVTVTFGEVSFADPQPRFEPVGVRSPIRVPVAALLACAQEMEARCPGDPCYRVLRSNLIKEVDGFGVRTCDSLSIQQVINIVGMVGSGKSTLIKVLAFWCHKNGYRLSIVVDTVAEVLLLWEYINAFGVSCSPLIGRSERLKYINQVVGPEKTTLPRSFSKYLTPSCLVDGMDAQHEQALTWGKEPCYLLQRNHSYHLCPFFDSCPGTEMLRACYTSSVVITTVAGFAAARVGHGRETFLELALRSFDLVVFDECDRAQKTMDQLFMPETSFDAFIHESAEDCRAYMQMSSRRREEDPSAQWYDEMQRQSVTVMGCIIKALHWDLGSWNRIAQGDPFSALTLLEDLHEVRSPYQIPDTIFHALYDLIDRPEEAESRQIQLWAALESSCKSLDDSLFNQIYRQWLEQTGTTFPRPSDSRTRHIQDARIKLIIRLIYFDHFIRQLRDAYAESHETSFGQNELFGFLQTRFRRQQHFLPSALCGNLLGLKKTDADDLILFRQFAFGRSLIKDLPYLVTDAGGAPAGPHALLLSGSSWAYGSYEYHINRPVNYILEADADKRTFLEKTGFYESGFEERVSGVGENMREEMLRKVTEKSVDYIIQEYRRNAGKILLVVNSYAQAEQVQQVLDNELRKNNCSAQSCRMVSDAVSLTNTAGTIRRGEVNRFATMQAEILIAPAMAIERGHNIVDETGHSALSAVFFLVRPMSVPDDIQQKGGKLNGNTEANCPRKEGESAFNYNQRIRQYASRQWVRMNNSRSFGLNDLGSDERRDVVATLFILILQIFGRLARVTDTTKPEAHVWFMDGAFRARSDDPGDFDCLRALRQYLDDLMTNTASAEIAKTLYEPFYHAFCRGIDL